MPEELIVPPKRSNRPKQGVKLRSADKVEHIPVRIIPTKHFERKPAWLRTSLSISPERKRVKDVLRANSMATVCEEASCPNLNECFSNGTATFMIMGEICTRRCPFCDVGHGRPNPLDESEPGNLARAILSLIHI